MIPTGCKTGETIPIPLCRNPVLALAMIPTPDENGSAVENGPESQSSISPGNDSYSVDAAQSQAISKSQSSISPGNDSYAIVLPCNHSDLCGRNPVLALAMIPTLCKPGEL